MTVTNEETTINLQNDITVNGKVYKAGQKVPVPKTQAEDISRMDYEHQQYKDNLHVKHTYETNAGTIAVG
jgi:hypothetical protein